MVKKGRENRNPKNIPVKVLNEDEKKDSKVKVRKEVGYPTEKSENAEMPSETKPKAAAKPKAEKAETKEAKPKAPKTKKTEE